MAESALLALVFIVIAGSAVALAFLFAYLLLQQHAKARRTWDLRRLQAARAEEQLRDFYGPLHALTLATRGVSAVAWGTDIWDQAWREVILPANQQIEHILLTKIHLLEDGAIPPSFVDFLKHSAINRSYRETGLTVDYLAKGVWYPEQFSQDIALGYDRARSRYLQFLQQE